MMWSLGTIAALVGASSLVAAASGCRVADVSALASEGTPTGKEEVHDGRTHQLPLSVTP